MAVVCPTILAIDSYDFQSQLNRVSSFAKRIQIDLTDGVFASSPTVVLDQVWWPDNITVDLHLMFENPADYINDIIKMNPSMVIVHAEASGNFIKLADKFHKNNIKVGVALLAKTSTHVIKPSIELIDHVLIFSGDLGKFGGIADLALTKKITQIKEWKKSIEIGWDGGINDKNAKELADSGVDVLNVGGYIQKSPEPAAMYNKLKNLIA